MKFRIGSIVASVMILVMLAGCTKSPSGKPRGQFLRKSQKHLQEVKNYFDKEIQLFCAGVPQDELEQEFKQIVLFKAEDRQQKRNRMVNFVVGKKYAAAPYSVYKEELVKCMQHLRRDYEAVSSHVEPAYTRAAQQIRLLLPVLEKINAYIVLLPEYDTEQKFLKQTENKGAVLSMLGKTVSLFV